MDEIVTTILTQANETFIGESTTAIPKALVEFFIVFGSFFIPCTLGSMISHFVKREKIVKQSLAEHKRVPKINKKKTIIGIFVSAILPSIIMTALYDVLQQKVNNGVVLMAVASLFGAIGDDLRKMLTLKGLIAIIKVITNGITMISQLEDAIDTSTDNTNKQEPPRNRADDPPNEDIESIDNNNETNDDE